MSTQPMYIGQGLLKVDPALTGLLAPRDPNAQTDDVAAQANTSPDDRFAGLLAPPTPQQAPAPTQTTPPNFPGGTPSIAGTPNANRSLLGRVHDSLISLFGGGPDAPTGYEGLLTPEEIASTKSNPGLLGLHQAGKSEDQIRKEKLATLYTGKTTLAAQQLAKKQLADRQAIYDEIGVPPTGDPVALRDWIGKAIPRLARADQYDAAAKLIPFADKLFTQAQATKEIGSEYINKKTGQRMWFSREPGTVIPPDFEKVQTGSSGTPLLFSGTKGGKPDYQTVNPNDSEKMADLVSKGYKPDIDSRTQYVQGMEQGRADNSLLARTQNAYTTQTKTLTDQAEVYNKAYQTLDRAANATDPNERKLLYGAVESQFTQASEQAKNLRFQLLQYYTKNQNPSLGNTFATFFDRLTKGELPPNVLQPMLSHIRALAAENKSQIDSHRTAFLKSHQGVVSDIDLPTSDSYYTYPGLLPGTNSASPSGAFDLKAWLKANPPAGKKP